MSYEPILLPSFKKSIKRLKRQYRHVADDTAGVIRYVLQYPESGTSIRLGCRKLRFPNTDANRGRRGGYRLIFQVNEQTRHIYLLLVYSKSQQADITKSEIDELVAEVKSYL